jgi:hypothetical protein
MGRPLRRAGRAESVERCGRFLVVGAAADARSLAPDAPRHEAVSGRT